MEEKMKTGGIVSGSSTLLEEMKILKEMQDQTGVRKNIHSELWHACAGPLVSLPHVGSLVYYFPQGHIEQVTISTKRPANSPVLNYPNLPPQIVCQVHNVTMHADKDTDEIFAQMSLQPIQSEKDALPISEFGSKSSEHPAEFFCKTLTASDTSSHGGFSVPRRAAEKLFPSLDYATQPPSQELIVRDLHDNTWTFRHVFRGQPKRHLLTTGWSTFVSSKRLRAGDSVLFIRDEKSQLMIGVRRANRQQTTLPSSVLSADTMHIGVLAAAAHAATNRSTFTVFYNPRACPSDFVIPVYKYRKAVHGVQISAGMRFGMMFETEESGKRRYMGTILGVSDLDPLRWPGSKWRTLQVEWDEAGCSNKLKRVSHWEIETPENLFLFSSLTSGFQHPFIPRYMGGEFEWGNPMKKPFIPAPDSGFGTLPYPSLPNLYSEQLMKMLLKPQTMNIPPANIQINAFVNTSPTCLDRPAHGSLRVEEPQVNKTNTNQTPPSTTQEKAKNVDHVVAVGSQKVAESGSTVKCNEVKGDVSGTTCNPVISSMNVANLNGILPHVDVPDWVPYATASTLQTSPIVSLPSGMDSNMLPAMGQELWSQQLAGSGALQSHQDPAYVQCEPNMNGLLGMSGDTNTQSGIYSCMEFDGATNCGSMMLDPSVSNALLGDLGTLKDAAFQYSTDCLLGNFGSSQDLQSQITSASLADFPDSSGGTSTSNVEFDESSLLQNKSWQQVIPPMRTYTKVQKAGSVGRSIDVTSFRTYDELRSEIERMFGLHGVLNDPRGVGWKLVYVDFENDVLLVGDDPWEEFVSCVRCIRILSPAEVEQMSLEGMQLL